MKNRILMCLFVLVLGYDLTQGSTKNSTIKGFSEAPRNLVKNGLLADPSSNFVLQAPSPEWQWLVKDNRNAEIKSYACSPGELLSTYFVHVDSTRIAALDDAMVKDIIRRSKMSLLGQNFILTKEGFTKSQIPFPGSYRTKLEFSTLQQQKLYVFGYLAYSNKIYLFEAYSLDNREPKTFKTFVSSFKLLKKPDISEPAKMQQRTSEIQRMVEAGDIKGAINYTLGYLFGCALMIWGAIAVFRKLRRNISSYSAAPRLTFSFYNPEGIVQSICANRIPLICGSDINCDLRIEGLLPVHFKVFSSKKGIYVQELSGGIRINSVPGSGVIRNDDVLETQAMTFRVSIQ